MRCNRFVRNAEIHCCKFKNRNWYFLRKTKNQPIKQQHFITYCVMTLYNKIISILTQFYINTILY